MKNSSSYIITKRIAKHGNQAVIVIPSVLHGKLRPKTLVRVTIDLIEESFGDVIGGAK
jgi:antitoxin component of MazEF toxin-antitoxin module